VPRRRETQSDEQTSRRRPATTPDERESQMINLADTLAEKQLREGTASAQVITHYLKLGSSRERLEQEKLALETELVKAKTEQIAGQQRQEELFAEAIKAMRAYQGGVSPASDETEEPEY
jgi:hypothetical protein